MDSNITVDQSRKNKEMLEDFVHDELTEIDFDDNVDEVLLYSPFDNPTPLEFQQNEDNEWSTGFESAGLTQSSTERRALIEQQNIEYNEALKVDQQETRKRKGKRSCQRNGVVKT